MRALVAEQRSLRKSVGLVPTMGALHQGHLSLIDEARIQSDFVVCSVFVNPAQFNNASDLEKYPRHEDEDCEKLSQRKCDAVFIPTVAEMYPDGSSSIKMNFGALEETMEGAFRPGHFSGVGLVVSKLFNIVQPQLAFFGTKDLQQLAVVKKLVRELNFPIEVVAVPTMREMSGLAMSSRNMLFTEAQKLDAAHLHEGLLLLKEKIEEGMSIADGKKMTIEWLDSHDAYQTEYVEVVQTDTMNVVQGFVSGSDHAICCAASVHGVRLIDNIAI